MDMYDILLARNLGSGEGGTTNYNALDNKPEINGETLQGDKDSTELKIAGKIANANFGEVFNNYSNNVAYGVYSHAEGNSTTASGSRSHAEGNSTIAGGSNSHAEGNSTIAGGSNSHAEGNSTIASGVASHAEGYQTTASAYYAHAEGGNTTASANFSHAEGNNTKASSNAQHVQGKYNIEDSAGKYAFIIGNGTADNARSNALAVDWNGDIYPANYGKGVNLAQLDTEIDTIREILSVELYGFRIDKQDSNPETRVAYMYDAAGKAPAHMDYTGGTFDYGDWANAWFIRENKPCALKYDGSIDYYLNPNDYTKKADGTASDVSDDSYAGNFMATMPTVWTKHWEDSRYIYVAFSNKQINDSYHAYAHDAGDGFINDFIYLPMFKGTVIDSKLRSIAGQYPTVNNTATVDRTAAVQCGTGWDMWPFSAHTLVTMLATLISKTTNTQVAFGIGVARDSSETTHDGAIQTGLNDLATGQFYGVYDGLHHVKLFHIEDYWGNRFERSVGLHLVDNKYMYKLTPPYTSSGSTTTYTLTNIDAPDAGYLTNCYVGEYGMLPKAVGGSTSTYFCDNFNVNSSGTRTAIFGGFYETLGNSGSYFISLATASGTASTTLGASPCYIPPHSA